MDFLSMMQNISLAAMPILIVLGLLQVKRALRRYRNI